MKSVVLTGGQAGITTDNNFSDATITQLKTKRLKEELKINDVVIVAGFQGVTEEGELTTLGRGGSDTSAVAIGVGVSAKKVEIYTDVDGIMRSDPKIVKEAKIIKEASYNEILNLLYSGAKVVHPRAIELAMNYDIPITVKPTFKCDEGTSIRKSNLLGKFENRKVTFTGVTHRKGMVQYSLKRTPKQQKTLLSKIKEHNVSLDMIDVSSEYIRFSIDENCTKIIEKNILKDNSYIKTSNLAKIALVGEKISGVSGVMSKIIDVLYENKIKVIQTNDSNTTIWLLINEVDLELSLNSIHEKLFQDNTFY